MPTTSRHIRANGLTFAIDEVGDGDDVALCLHGFPESRASWAAQLPILAAQGWRAVAPDMRGYGDSSRPRGLAAYRMERLLDDVEALYEALGARRRLLIGHDWGGLVAWSFAAGHRPVDGLIIFNAPHLGVYRDQMRRSPAQWGRSWYVLFFQLPWLPEAALTAHGAQAVARAFQGGDAAVAPQLVERFRLNALAPGAMTAMLNYYRANVRGFSKPRTAPPPISAPTLMIWGDRDRFLGVELTEGYGPYVADLTLRRIADGSHWVQQEQPGLVATLMGDWLVARGLGRTS